MLLAVLWVMGHGMHLAANSINNLAEKLANNQVIDITGTTIYQLTYFFDEHLSHYLWHLGTVGMAVLLLYREWRRPAGYTTTWWAAILGGVLYGITWFCIFLEGQTVGVGLPFSLVIVLLSLILGTAEAGRKTVGGLFPDYRGGVAGVIGRLGTVLGRFPAIFRRRVDVTGRFVDNRNNSPASTNNGRLCMDMAG